MPKLSLIHANDASIDRLIKVTQAGGNSKLFTGETLLAKAKRDSTELQNSYMPLLTNEVVRSYLNIGSGKNWDQIQETFCLRMWQECYKLLLEICRGCKAIRGRGEIETGFRGDDVTTAEGIIISKGHATLESG